MPIHDQGYRRYGGGKARGQGWLVIARSGIRSFFGRKAFLGLLAAAWLPFVLIVTPRSGCRRRAG